MARLRLITSALVVFAVTHALYAAWDQDWTWDEGVHLAWSRRLLDDGNDERASLGRFDSKTPIMLPGILLGKAAQAAGLTSEPAVRFAQRLPTVGWLAGLLIATFYLARRIADETAAHLATIAAALDPNLVANGSLATVDVVYALGVVLTISGALAFRSRPSFRHALYLGLGLGLAFTAKFSSILLIPALAGLPLLVPAPAAEARPSRRRLAAALLVTASLALMIVCAAYLFMRIGARLDGLGLVSRPFTALVRFAPGLRLPLPAAFITGVDQSIARDHSPWRPYLFGTFHPGGVWYYYVAHWLLKTPLLLLVAEIIGLIRLARGGLVAHPPARFIAFVFLIHLTYFSLLFRTQIGYRFALMCIPLGYVLAASGLRGWKIPRAALVGAVVVVVALAESLYYWGNPLAFTHAGIWPKRSVWRLMADSNVDYGQDRGRIRRYLADLGTPTHLNPLHVLPGHNTVDLSDFVGIGDPERYRWLRENLPPDGQIGFTHLYWVLDDDTYERYLSEARWADPSPQAAELCQGELPRYAAGSRIPVSFEEPPGRTRTFVACVSVKKPTDLGLRTESGIIRFGPGELVPGCGESISAGQVSVYRLRPGLHALCLAEIPNRRAYIPYRFHGAWLIRGHGASLDVREVSVRQ
jgi:hypothetical protein